MLVTHLAAFHAYLLCLDEESSRQWKDRYCESPLVKSGFKVFFTKYIEMLLEMDRARFEPPFRRLKRTMMELDFGIYVTEGCLEELSLPEVLINGDFHTQNIMWKTVGGQEGGEVSDEVAALVDWQVVHKGKAV